MNLAQYRKRCHFNRKRKPRLKIKNILSGIIESNKAVELLNEVNESSVL